MFKKIAKFLLVFILVLGFAGCGSNKSNSGKVKVYVFEAGGCPYCEAQLEYLKSLEGYDKEFEVIEKELYVDHIEWQAGKDYQLGVKVANAFNKAGFQEASYQGAPFVVISDTYAAAAFNQGLEEEIKKVAEEGDNDIVGCFEKGDDCELREKLTETDKKIRDVRNVQLINYIIIYSLLGLIIAYLVYSKTKESNNAPKRVVEIKIPEKKEEPVKKTPVKKSTTTKKTTKKKK